MPESSLPLPLPPDSMAFAFWHATESLARVMAGRSLAEGFLQDIPAIARPQARHMVYGVLRRYGEGEALLSPLLRETPRTNIMALLLLAVYCLESRPSKSHTVINQAVKTATLLEGGYYRNLVNGVLRNFVRRREALFATLPETARLWHPDWWIARLKAAYPNNWQDIVAACNLHPPMALRVNLRRTTQAACLQRLEEAGMEAELRGSCGLLLKQPVPVDRLPGFQEGELSVQDLGAQRAAQILSPSAGARVLDACAAPGGKASHLLEQGDNLTLVAHDIDPARCQRIRDNLARLGLTAQVRVADAAATFGDGKDQYDAIMADLPCSSSGVARRFSDVKWLRREADIVNYAKTQARILAGLWPLLQKRGKLLYATCSLFPQENEDQIGSFLKQNPDASLQHEEHCLPDAEQDGFYYALLQKQF